MTKRGQQTVAENFKTVQDNNKLAAYKSSITSCPKKIDNYMSMLTNDGMANYDPFNRVSRVDVDFTYTCK